ncbi:hypothetical protein Y1Q_0001917 [Alligator mississippiensis]|uniref:Uncharacterized protein n=1 Tax=Alligator mississippiensis TaxID=8496 RepID=A0A151PG69_ALLMI|nr:hypothetical protein Y1Q_0001917 [Alligator mississippiensis]
MEVNRISPRQRTRQLSQLPAPIWEKSLETDLASSILIGMYQNALLNQGLSARDSHSLQGMTAPAVRKKMA